MKADALIVGAVFVTALSATALITPTQAPPGQFTLADVIPNDVFLYAAERHNPERQFLDDYWAEVFGALAQSGVYQDAMELVGSLLGAGPAAEVERLRERAAQLMAGVNWKQLVDGEQVFAERFGALAPSAAGPPVTVPEMVWLFRGNVTGAAQNYAGLAAMLEALVEEINRAAGSPVLTVTRTERLGAQVTSVDLLALLPGAPQLPLSVGLREDVVIVALREHLLDDVLALMAGRSAKRPLGADPRFRAAFAQLPPAEDSMTFFDVQAMIGALRTMLRTVFDMARAPGDVYLNTGMSQEENALNLRAMSAYQSGDVEQALALTEQLHRSAPRNAIVLYNLACFNALLGNREAALNWLEQAVDGGFYAPTKIATDRDLDSLRDEARYKAALARAGELAAAQRAEDIVINSSRNGEAHALLMQALQAYEAKDYEQGLKLVEQAYAAAPKDARVLYSLACFHALLGHKDRALEFLQAAVEGGFCCPRHISQDPDLDSLRGDERYQAALALARQKAAQLTSAQTGQQIAWVRFAVDQLAEAFGILDHVAAVERTDGYAVWTESVTALVPDARSRPAYRLFSSARLLTDFDRYLPQETASFSASGGFDPAALYQFVEDAVRQLGPQGEELLARWAELQARIGVDVRKDIIDWIDGGFIRVDLADGGGSVWLLKVTDESAAREKVGAAIEFLATRLPEVVSRSPMLAPLAVMSSLDTSPVQREDLPGFQNLQFAFQRQPAVWGVADGYLVVGTSADAAALCLATARGEHPGIRQNARLMAEAIIPDGPFASVSLSDERASGEELARGIGTASMISGVLGSLVPEPRPRLVITKVAGLLTKLVPVARKIDFYKSRASLTTFDGQAWRTRSVTHYLAPDERTPDSAAPAAAGGAAR